MTTPTTNKLILLEDARQIIEDIYHTTQIVDSLNALDALPTYTEPIEYEIGKEYLFSDDMKKWKKWNFIWYKMADDWFFDVCSYIRPLIIPPDITSAIALLEQDGYIITKK